MRIGFIGLGIMGFRMASNLLNAGYDMTVYNRTKTKADTLIHRGAKWADSPAELARNADIVITMVADPDAVRKSALEPDGFLPHMRNNSLWINTSTVNPSFARQMAAESESRGVRFVDAPVAGSKMPAEKGELIFFAGGNRADMDACGPLFDVMGKKTVHTGEAGTGSGLKMLFNLLLGTGMAMFAEVLNLGQSLGFSKETLFSTLVGSPVVPGFIEGKRGKMDSGDFAADFPLKWMHKDLYLAALTAYEQQVPMPGAAAVRELFGQALQAGYGDADFSALARFLEPDDEDQ
ncbi:MAG: NAD(P)-dependent oxidoreductase [Desulfobacterales bacterium]